MSVDTNTTELQNILDTINDLPEAGDGSFSPTIDVTPIEGGHQVTIGSETFTVMDGTNGNDGDDGKSAYQIAYALDSTIGTEVEWIASLKGEQGDPFEYEDFLPAQLEALKPKKGTDYFDGDDYILTDADKTEIANETRGLLDGDVQEIREIASGKCKADAFDTVEAMAAWLSDPANTTDLKLGDVFYIRDIGVPDYWWEPIKERVELRQYTVNDIVISGVGAARILETTKVELEDYALIANVPGIKVNNAVNADTIGGRQIVVTNVAPDPNGEDNQNIITIVI